MTDFFYSNYTLNLYRGCSHGCIYCDSHSVCYHMASFGTVRKKADCLALLRQELAAKRRSGMIFMGSGSDPYNPFEQAERLTRGSLELIRRYRFGISLSTKSHTILQDADLLADIQRIAPVNICFSITCAEDAMCRLVEPEAAYTSLRFEAMEALVRKGVFCGLWLNPVLPFITDSWCNLKTLLAMTKEAGGQFAVCHFGMTLREGSRELYYKGLDEGFPGLKERYVRTFGNSYLCPSPHAAELEKLYRQECERLGLFYRFKDINTAVMAPRFSQLSFC
ncbi:MAG: radical SAM protein [Clostridia bacterium]|nr:radical SAM protein [Clostridia bacterium]